MNMRKTLSQNVSSTSEGKRLLQQECAILEVTELICDIMEDTGVSRSQLAERLGKSRGYVTQLLDGRANMTIRTVADIFTALGTAIHFHHDREAEAGEIKWDFMTRVGRDAVKGEVEICPSTESFLMAS
jgi:transcriptional regulator with XRE-family HTH domain